jgi:TIR domain
MRLLAEWVIDRHDGSRRIQLLHGDLSHIPLEHAVDVLVVSAFPNDYVPTPSSLIGALHRSGLSVRGLAYDKHIDLRRQFSCWLSKPVPPTFNFRRLLCVESGWRGTPPEITDDIFRALAPYLLTDFPNSSVAMPLIGAGDQGYNPEEMLTAILQAAVSWIKRGLTLRTLKIVVYNHEKAQRALAGFLLFRRNFEDSSKQRPSSETSSGPFLQYDIFISYARKDLELASFVELSLRASSQSLRVFFDKTDLRVGASWPMQIANALDHSRRVIALYSASYWASKNCELEFMAAFTRQNDTGATVLFPMYLSDAQIPYLFLNLQHADCRINDKVKTADACSRLLEGLV